MASIICLLWMQVVSFFQTPQVMSCFKCVLRLPIHTHEAQQVHTKILRQVHHVDRIADLQDLPIGQLPNYGLLPHGCMSIIIIWNRLAARFLPKDYLYILDHIEYILTTMVVRLCSVLCLTFKMLAFLSQGVIQWKKSMMAHVHDLSIFFKNILSMSSKQCVHALYPLFDCPERLLRASESLIVMNNNARRSKCSCLYSSHTHTPVLLHKSRSSSTNSLRYTSISLLGCFGLWMSTGIIMNFRFMHNHGGRLQIHRVTCQVL